jgi:hypothetical protein
MTKEQLETLEIISEWLELKFPVKDDKQHLLDTIDYMSRFLGLVGLHHSQYTMMDHYIKVKEKEVRHGNTKTEVSS